MADEVPLVMRTADSKMKVVGKAIVEIGKDTISINASLSPEHSDLFRKMFTAVGIDLIPLTGFPRKNV